MEGAGIFFALIELGTSLYKKWEQGNAEEKSSAEANARASLQAAKNEFQQTQDAHQKLWGAELAKGVGEAKATLVSPSEPGADPKVSFDPNKVTEPT
jgi:hypothetical protein